MLSCSLVLWIQTKLWIPAPPFKLPNNLRYLNYCSFFTFSLSSFLLPWLHFSLNFSLWKISKIHTVKTTVQNIPVTYQALSITINIWPPWFHWYPSHSLSTALLTDSNRLDVIKYLEKLCMLHLFKVGGARKGYLRRKYMKAALPLRERYWGSNLGSVL